MLIFSRAGFFLVSGREQWPLLPELRVSEPEQSLPRRRLYMQPQNIDTIPKIQEMASVKVYSPAFSVANQVFRIRDLVITLAPPYLAYLGLGLTSPGESVTFR